MKTLTKFLTAAVAAASLASFAAPALASQTIATNSYLGQDPNFTWVNNGGTGAGAGGTLTGFASGLVDTFNFIDPLMAGATGIAATFNLTATSLGNAATLGGGGTYTQTGLNGSFSFIAATSGFFGGHFITLGSNLLSGTFTDAWIQGGGASGSTNVTVGNGGSACFSSAYLAFSCGPNSNGEYAFTLLNANPGFNAGANMALTSFTADGDGRFSVPEPGTWALMIMGFGGVGALVRNRRRQAAFA